MAAGHRPCKLEASATTGRLLDSYDAAADAWRVPLTGPFWDAVTHAHALGQRGAGKRIAMIDTAPDLSLPCLASRVDEVVRVVPAPFGTEDTAHGTAVALLIARVAPEARITSYAVAREDGSIDASDVAYALQAASAGDAAVINVSLGAWRTIGDLDARLAALDTGLKQAMLAGPDPLGAKQAIMDAILPDAGCDLCAAASAAVAAGKMVFAAAGNAAEEIMCPARAPGVTALGFAAETTLVVPAPDGGSTEVSSAGAPHAPQSPWSDIALREIDGVLGTSFAAPMFAGAAALGLRPAELPLYLRAVPPAMTGAAAQRALAQGAQGRRRQDAVATGLAAFRAALERLPHVHTALQSRFRAGAPVVPPAGCTACGLFAHPTFVNAGLFLLNAGDLIDAADLLDACVTLFPWDPHSAANRGRLLEANGRLADALAEYDRALSLRPGFAVYMAERAKIAALLTPG